MFTSFKDFDYDDEINKYNCYSQNLTKSRGNWIDIDTFENLF